MTIVFLDSYINLDFCRPFEFCNRSDKSFHRTVVRHVAQNINVNIARALVNLIRLVVG